MMLEFATAILFTAGWSVVFAYRTEDLTETLPALEPAERWVSYGMIAANSLNMAVGCLLITLTEVSLASAIVGVVVYLLGIGLWFWGRTQICPLDMKKLPGQAPLRLRRDGAFGLVRHPLYCGMILAGLAPLLVTRSPLVLLTFIPCVVVMRMRMVQEERVLRQQLGAEYEDYQRQVSQLIPWLW